jgi:ABC-type glycerol-3-phosphate transport system permease component
MMKRHGKWVSLVFWIAASLVTLFPIYWMFVVSAKSRVELFGKPNFIIKKFFVENYTNTLADPSFQKYLINSIIVASCNALLVTTLALFATYALSRFKLVGRENIFFWTITNRMAPPAVFLLPLFLLFTQAFAIGDWKLYDTRIGLILLYCVFNLPFAIWTMRSVTKVIIPLARPGLAVTAILTWVFAWNEYLFAATLTSVHARTITTGLAEFVTVTGTNWGQMAATATLTLLPALLFLGLVQRHIVAGLTFGAVKE